MKDLSKTWLLFILVHFVVSGCNNKESDKVEITIKSTTQPSAKVILSINYALEVVTIGESQTDSLGNCSFEMTSAKADVCWNSNRRKVRRGLSLTRIRFGY